MVLLSTAGAYYTSLYNTKILRLVISTGKILDSGIKFLFFLNCIFRICKIYSFQEKYESKNL